MRKLSLLLFLYSALTFSLISCVNEEYDITKIEVGDIAALKGLTVPVGSSKIIYLNEIFELDSDGYIKVDEQGNYYVLMSDPELINEVIDVPDFSFAGYDKDNPNDFTIDNPLTIPSLDPGYKTPVIPFTDVVYDIQIEQNDIPDMVGGIVYAEVKSDLIVKFQYDPASLPFNYITIASGTTVSFPEWVILGEPADFFKKLSDNELELTEDIKIAPSGSLLDFPLVGLDFTKLPENQGIIGKNHLYLDAKAYLKGGIVFESDGCTAAGTFKPVVTTYLHMDPMEIEKVQLSKIDLGETAQITQYIDITEAVPEVLYNDNIVYDFNNLQLYMKLHHNLPFSGIIDASMETTGHDSPSHNFAFEMPFAEYKGIGQYVETEYKYTESGKDGTIRTEGFNSLLNPIPEEIRVVADVDVDDIAEKAGDDNGYGVVIPGTTYKFGCGYEFIAPLSFGSKFSITLDEEIKDLDIDITDVGIAEAELKFNLISTLPLDVKLTAQAIDQEGNILTDIAVKIEGNIKSGNIDAPAVNPIKVKLSNKGSLKVDGVKLKMEATASSDNINLNENQYLQLTDISLSLPKGITYHVE
jgi:hypothetical protein